MGYQESKSQTELGINYISQYFLLSFILTLAVTLFSLALLFSGENLINFANSNVSLVMGLVFIFVFILIWLIRGLAGVFNGRFEFDREHESNVIFATILIIFHLIVLIINLGYSKGFFGGAALISAISTGFSGEITIQFIINIILSTVSQIIFGLALIYLIFQLATRDQRRKMWNIFYLFIFSSITLNITYLVGIFLIYKIYREVFFFLHEGKIKAAENAPCPNCDRPIPIESRNCPYCNVQFKRDASIEVDPRLNMEAPRERYVAPKGYAPIEGPSEEEKRKVKKIIFGLIAAIIVIVVIVIIFRIISNS